MRNFLRMAINTTPPTPIQQFHRAAFATAKVNREARRKGVWLLTRSALALPVECRVVDDRRQLVITRPIAVKTLALGWLVQWLGHEFDNSVLKEAAALAWLEAIELRTLFMHHSPYL